MPISWIEKNISFQVKVWAFDLFKSGEVLFSGDRAEIEVSDEDVERFKPDLEKAVPVIMFSQGVPIDDPDYDFQIEEIEFLIECCD
jgi:hypothetical protein